METTQSQANPPSGKYLNVSVYSILDHSQLLSGGTGTYSEIHIFSCGEFTAGYFPVVGGKDRYNITGTHGGTFYDFNKMSCIHSGKTSDFKEQVPGDAAESIMHE